MTSAERRMLRIQDAMAHVTVREHDVCSLATNIGWDDGELRIICCLSDPSVDKHSATDTVSDGASAFSFKNLVVYLTRNWNSSNDSKDDREVAVPTLPAIEKPEYVGAVDALKYFETLNGSRKTKWMTCNKKAAYRVEHSSLSIIDEWIAEGKMHTEAPTANPHNRGLTGEYPLYQDNVECILNIRCKKGLSEGNPDEFTLILHARVPPTTGFLMYHRHSLTVVIDQYITGVQ
ncbi:hypothetical protein BDN70DRAFT_934638 [Pholiota conissans]|uniref:Uncharacterized protein n=1 Tax=Pholiota conissans TaxID=109636 RepID=A0A9P6CYS9_9AGAR|nr:hypothetical protein BDN70DRAFT_934638 [Pholiota conissans]